MAVACGGNSSSPAPDGSAGDRPVGFEVTVRPFIAEGNNVSVTLPEGIGSLLWGVSLTQPGIHWEWDQSVRANVSVTKGGAVSLQQGLDQGVSLDPLAERVEYQVSLNSVANAGWPVAVGRVGAQAASLTLSSYFFLLPDNLTLPLHICFVDTNEILTVFVRGQQQSDNCVDFANFAEALDTPVFVARPSVVSEQVISDAEGFPFYVSVDARISNPLTQYLETIREGRLDSLRVWKALVERWGRPWIGDNFATHFLLSPLSASQGLEHHSATVIAVGVGQSDFAEEIVHLTVHEMIHVWNGKHLYPTEAATWYTRSFSQERLRQIYFYEGFTEAFARLALVEFVPNLRSRVMDKWNDSFRVVANSGTGHVLTASNINWHDYYDVGAVVALWLAVRTRQAHGVTLARERFWNLLPTLAEVAWGAHNPLTEPVWEFSCFADSQMLPCAASPVGYTHENLLTAMEQGLAPQDWQQLKTALTGITFADEAALLAVLQEVASVTGVPLVQGTCVESQCLSLAVVGDADARWPL